MTLPLIGPSPAAGAVLAWSRALGEFRATITSAGNLPGVTQTVPLAIYMGYGRDKHETHSGPASPCVEALARPRRQVWPPEGLPVL